ncbi:hypothetical protein CYLTODRAFT_449480 [Cylindrobasidium torrendii FP15055 ss-10]|uniref:Complex 1 LYR protein domain-containing protein n=1 Tax=Cylindrobasidium torrendii FP15055 ss-10 TaxID=1314674 RepID=A0A0D7BT17_9AGAR|nr:hypothetical protein CYLTODRAFT_449480 [Cylindrobasidium torrendii FP15055 ss-10]
MPQPTLKHFILRQKTLDLYKQAVRASRAIPDPATRRETIGWIRSEIERTRWVFDTSVIESLQGQLRRDIKIMFPGSNG